MRIRPAIATLATLGFGVAAVTAQAAPRVQSAHGATLRALVSAFVHVDGSTTGITGVFVAGGQGAVCRLTPDAGRERTLFTHARGRWRYAFTTTAKARGTVTQRALERACG